MGLIMHMAMARMNTEPAKLLLLLNLLSPSFPTGAFAYSHGLEWAIAEDGVKSANDVEQWIADLITVGSGWNDAVLFAQCWKNDSDPVNALALALSSSKERYHETTQLGRGFLIAAAAFVQMPVREGETAYPIAAGLACCHAGMEKEQALLAFLQGFCAALVSVAVRLVPLGQTNGLNVLRNLMPAIIAMAQRASHSTLEDIGSAAFLADIASMNHEHLETRIFRT